jgi:hypothetical protein
VASVEILPLTVVRYVKTSGIVDDRVKLRLGQRISRYASCSENKQVQTYVVHPNGLIRIALIRSTSRLEARWEPVSQSGVVRGNQMWSYDYMPITSICAACREPATRSAFRMFCSNSSCFCGRLVSLRLTASSVI